MAHRIFMAPDVADPTTPLARPAIQETVRALRTSGCPSVKVLIGGAPVTPRFAEEIGANGYAPDAGSAVDKAHALVAGM